MANLSSIPWCAPFSVMADRYRIRRQKGHGFLSPALLKAAKAGLGSGLTLRTQVMRPEDYKRLALRRKMQGRGPKWDAFKRGAKKLFKWASPRAKKALKNAIPKVENLVLNTPKGERKAALKLIGKEGISDFVGGGRRRRRYRGKRRRR